MTMRTNQEDLSRGFRAWVAAQQRPRPSPWGLLVAFWLGFAVRSCL